MQTILNVLPSTFPLYGLQNLPYAEPHQLDIVCKQRTELVFVSGRFCKDKTNLEQARDPRTIEAGTLNVRIEGSVSMRQ